MLIRPADPHRDAAACAAIYAPFVSDTPVSLEEEPPDTAELERRIASITASFPWLVAEDGGAAAAFAYASQHRPRASYRWAADVSVYVSPTHHRRGIGSALYRELLALIRAQGYRMACAGITVPNDASVRLHESLGFELVGIYRAIGYKLGAWRDVGWWQLPLAGRGPAGRAPAAGPGAALVALFQQQRQRRAGVGSPAGERQQLVGYLGLVEHRVAPLVEADQLGEHLGAQPVRLAGDRVDPQPSGHRFAGRGRPAGRPGQRAAGWPRVSPKISSALSASRPTPSGWWHAPRPRISSDPVGDPLALGGVGDPLGQRVVGVGDGAKAMDAGPALAGGLV